MVTHALVTLQLDCCNALYMGLFVKNIWKLQLVQSADTALGISQDFHIIQLIHMLHWFPVCF